MGNGFYIIADDVTGANDCGAQFAKHGYPTTVYFSTSNICDIKETEITVIDSNTRGLSDIEAYSAVKNIINNINTPANCIFKKIDSTLRGNIRAETRAILDEKQGSIAFIVPAYPSNGRTTRNGKQYLFGRPVHTTEIGLDPKTPVLTSNIRDLLQAPCYMIGIEDVEKGIETLNILVKRACAEGYRNIIYDAVVDKHLETIASLYSSFPQAVWVGSAGITEYLKPDIPVSTIRPTLLPIQKPLLFITGSLSESTYEQVMGFMGSNIYKLILDPITVLESKSNKFFLEAAAQQYLNGSHIVIALKADTDARQQTKDFALKRGVTLSHISNCLCRALGKMACELVDVLLPSGIFISGGDTARSVLEQLGIKGIQIIDELEPGIPVGKALTRNMYVITKAGAFGNKYTFYNIVEKLCGNGDFRDSNI